jgi:2-(1,2-epoxy-1,2-dihydrophenyl)acetyl-CoA isomerase
MTKLETVDYSVANRVAIIALDRAEARNALNAALRRELLLALSSANDDSDVRVVIVTGNGKSFCAGADLREGPPETSVEEHLNTEYKPILMAISQSTKPYISAINGAAAGVGGALAMACDLSVMAQDGYLLQAFAAIGLAPDGGVSWQLVNTLGRKRAYEVMLSGEKLSAQRCLDWGLVNRVVPGDELLDAARSWAEALAEKAPLAMRYSKEALLFAQNHDLDATISFEAKLQGVTSKSEDLIEGVTAFYEKRKAVFKGR